MNSNASLAQSALTWLYNYGVREVVLCPGARCAPLINALESCSGFKVQTHFDERAAGFYALGRIPSLNRPVAIITTSGTAVSELLSAVIEAHYSELPLIVLSTDRPKSYRGSGAPQTIEQARIFSEFVEFAIDADQALSATPTSWSGKKPVHINVCFDEPLWPSTMAPWQPHAVEVASKTEDPQSPLKIPSFKNPLVIVSGSWGFPKELVLEHLKRWDLPIYLEGPSGLKGHPELRDKEIFFPEKWIQNQWMDGVIRIGHIPTTRLWRDLEASSLPVLNLSHKSFSGLSRTTEVFPITEENLNSLGFLKFPDLSAVITRDQESIGRLRSALQEFPLSEPALLSRLQNHWPVHDLVFLGNSLPIREWDLVSAVASQCYENVWATRGTNGIDGQISTFYGLSSAAKTSSANALGIFGDLTTLYDLNAPWILNGQTQNHYVAIINNSGGKIFDRMFKSPLFQNQHQLKFKNWAKLWNLPHTDFNGAENPFQGQGGIIEITPNATQTQKFWEMMK